MYKNFESTNNKISSWESKGLSSEKITSYNNRVPELVLDNARIKLRFTGVPLKQDKVTYNQGPIVNIYTVYRLIFNSVDFGLTVQNCLFGAVKLTKGADISKNKYSGYGIGFDSKESFTHPSGGYGRNVIIFGADLSSSTHANNKARSILVIGKDFIRENRQYMQTFMQKKCIPLILRFIIKHFV